MWPMPMRSHETPMQPEAMVANLSKRVRPAKLLLRSVAFTKKKFAIALVDDWFSITFKAFSLPYISVGFPFSTYENSR
jgi:hypothetical protein